MCVCVWFDQQYDVGVSETGVNQFSVVHCNTTSNGNLEVWITECGNLRIVRYNWIYKYTIHQPAGVFCGCSCDTSCDSFSFAYSCCFEEFWFGWPNPPPPPLSYFLSTMVSRVCFDRGRSYRDGCCRATSCSKNTFSALTAFPACTLTAMPLASTNLTLFYLTSKVLHTPGSTQTNFYPQLVFTQTLFYTKHFLQNHFNFCTNKLLHTPRFAPTNLYKPVSHKSAFTQTSFYTNRLLHKPPFTQTTFYTNQLYTTSALGL